MTKSGQSAQKPYALTGSARRLQQKQQPNTAHVQVGSQFGKGTVSTVNDNDKR